MFVSKPSNGILIIGYAHRRGASVVSALFSCLQVVACEKLPFACTALGIDRESHRRFPHLF